MEQQEKGNGECSEATLKFKRGKCRSFCITLLINKKELELLFVVEKTSTRGGVSKVSLGGKQNANEDSGGGVVHD